MLELEYFMTISLVSGLAVSVVQEILKLKIIPLSFANRYPVPTNIVLSVIASIVAISQHGVLELASWLELASTAGFTAVVAAITYNNLMRNWTQLQSIEGEK